MARTAGVRDDKRARTKDAQRWNDRPVLMRHRDPHDDPPAKRRPARYSGPPVTLGHIRSHGVRRLLIHCTHGLYCHHSALVDADRWPDDTVLLDLDRRAVCTKCGTIGADVRPNWSERPPPESPDRRAAVAAANSCSGLQNGVNSVIDALSKISLL
jgi:hypothetical protein